MLPIRDTNLSQNRPQIYDARRGDKKCKCLHCGKEFWAARRTAKYHSPACRKAAERDRKLLNTETQRAMKAVDIICSFFHEDDKTDMKARRQLTELRNYIDGKITA